MQNAFTAKVINVKSTVKKTVAGTDKIRCLSSQPRKQE